MSDGGPTRQWATMADNNGRVQPGEYNSVGMIHGPRACGKTTLGMQLLLSSPGYHVVIAPRIPRVIDGEQVRYSKVAHPGALARSVFWRPGNAHLVTTPGDCIDDVISVCKHIVANTAEWGYIFRGQRDLSPVVPCTVLLDEGSRWGALAAGRRGQSAVELYANARHWGIGLIVCTQSPRMIDELYFSLSTDVYSYQTWGLDTRRLRLSNQFSEAALSRMATLPEHEYMHTEIGTYRGAAETP